MRERIGNGGKWLGVLALVALAFGACGPQSSINRAGVAVERDGSAGSGGNNGGGGGRPGPNPGPTKTALGKACTTASACASGNCADGVCCESACTGPCSRCNLAGSEGSCAPVAKGEDPDEECLPQAPDTCGTDGVCDGAGACQKHAAGTMCGTPGCEGATEHAAATCDGQGACKAGATKSCAPAVCIEQSCGAPCALHTDCQTGFWCDSGTCRIKRDAAATCAMDAECMSGFCADGVCCNTACKEKCMGCAVEGTAGTCTPIGVGRDPDNECPVQGIVTCQNAGGCDGKGACRLHDEGLFCANASCAGSTVTGMSTCDGKGGCKPGAKSDCGNYVCNGPMACWTACSTNDQCKSGKTCKSGSCQ